MDFTLSPRELTNTALELKEEIKYPVVYCVDTPDIAVEISGREGRGNSSRDLRLVFILHDDAEVIINHSGTQMKGRWGDIRKVLREPNYKTRSSLKIYAQVINEIWYPYAIYGGMKKVARTVKILKETIADRNHQIDGFRK